MNDQLRHFQLDMSEPDLAPERRGGDRHGLRLGLGARRWLAIVAALAVGVALGGAGVGKERDAAAAREARRTISLVAALSGTGDPTGREAAFPVTVRIYNAGPRVVRILAATLLAPGFRSAPTQTTTRTDVDPRTWSLLTPTLGMPDCSRPADSPLKLTVLIDTADRSRQVTVPVVDAGANLGEVLGAACTGPPDILGALDVSVHPPLTFGERSGRPVLRVMLDAAARVPYPDDEVATITGQGSSDLVRTSPVGTYPLHVTPPNQASGTVELSIATCRKPLADYGENDFNIPVRVSSDLGERTLFAWASAAVAVQIAELYHRTCG
jgi:hypothetical protein